MGACSLVLAHFANTESSLATLHLRKTAFSEEGYTMETTTETSTLEFVLEANDGSSEAIPHIIHVCG
jgi:hypothetical protein